MARNRRTVRGFERAIEKMIEGWQEYAEAHNATYESQIGDDAVIGEEWAEIGQALLGLLNGELGRLDGGTLSSYIRRVARSNGVRLFD